MSLVLVILVGLLLESPLLAQSPKWDGSYVADDTFAIIGLDVQRILNYEAKDSELRKQLSKSLERIGINNEELDQCHILMRDEVGERSHDHMYQVKLIFNKPQDFDSIFEKKWPERLEPARHKGMKYFKSSNYYSAFAPTNKMLVFDYEDRLLPLMESMGSGGEFVKRIKAANGDADIFFTIDQNKVTAEWVRGIAVQMEEQPFDLRAIAAEAKHAVVTIDLGGDNPLVGSIEAKDNNGAERLKRAADALISLCKIEVKEMKREFDDEDFGDDELRRMIEMGESAIKVAEVTLNAITISTEGAQVKIRVARKGGIAEGAKLLILMANIVVDETAYAIEN